MFKTLTLAGAALATVAAGVIPATAADAQYRSRYGQRYDRGYNDGYSRSYRDDRRRQKCKDGDGGTIIGAVAGGLLGRTIDTRGDRLLGTVLGAGAGALAGRAIDRSDRPGYCR